MAVSKPDPLATYEAWLSFKKHFLADDELSGKGKAAMELLDEDLAAKVDAETQPK